eukprot:NODE_691_length_5161_cov_0.244567.p1 type:complete len:969 gc:universal NODE_691_length_5161_cov_0.244567:3223-317(-)
MNPIEIASQDFAKLFCILRELEVYSDQDILQFTQDVCNAETLDILEVDNGDTFLNARTSMYGQKLALKMNEAIDKDIMEYMHKRLVRLSTIRNRYNQLKNNRVAGAISKLIPVEEDMMSIEEVPEINDVDYEHMSPQDSDEEYGIPSKRRSSFALERPDKRVKLNELKQWTLLSKRVIKHAKHFPKTFNARLLNNIKDVAKHQISHVDLLSKCKQLTKDVGVFIRKKDKQEREHRKKAEKEQFEKNKALEELRESQRQARKLNFLLTQTEIYSHFIGKKTDLIDTSNSSVTSVVDFDNDNDELLRKQAETNAQNAFLKCQENANEFNQVSATIVEQIQQPKKLNCTLKSYQIKGLNWLAGLYEQGINGILADEMGLGKTVQSISLLAYVAEKYNIWGPFLIVTPASTLHNWQNEFSKFIPDFKTVPYWGTSKERASMRSLFRAKGIWTEDSQAHVVITSYQLAVQDQQYLSRLKWQFLILDEAHSIKSSSSVRWNTLLKFNCRNRLLLTGTPIQNSLHELWALLHFIMPTLFDNHQEFAEWFSKGIESDTKSMNEHQLKRLQAILKPFMLRRVKADVENELPEKIEIEVPCPLTHHQKKMYKLLKKKVNLKDLLEKANLSTNKTDDTLMNLMMHFRKITNHPELFERSDAISPLHFGDLLHNNCDSTNESFLYSGKWFIASYPKLLGLMLIERKENEKLFSKYTNILTPEYLINDYCWWSSGFNTSRFHIAKLLLNTELPTLQEKPNPLITYHTPIDLFYIPKVTCEPLEITFKSVNIDYSLKADRTERLHRHIVLEYGYPMSFYDQHTSSVYKKSRLSKLDTELATLLLNNNKPCGLGIGDSKRHLSFMTVPGIWDLIRASGKLLVLDSLLPKLKDNDHKVLIYFQMTKMMDIMEEYLSFRGYQYVRLDGSTSIEERNEKVQNFQNTQEIFIFLLSTRAGGVGINLTAADTVVFYDQDWNPTYLLLT